MYCSSCRLQRPIYYVTLRRQDTDEAETSAILMSISWGEANNQIPNSITDSTRAIKNITAGIIVVRSKPLIPKELNRAHNITWCSAREDRALTRLREALPTAASKTTPTPFCRAYHTENILKERKTSNENSARTSHGTKHPRCTNTEKYTSNHIPTQIQAGLL